MKRILFPLLLVMVLVLSGVSVAFAAHGDSTGEPTRACPDNFNFHPLGHHDSHDLGQHKHVGNDSDFNDDGWICGKHVSVNGNVHVHIDNNKPFKN